MLLQAVEAGDLDTLRMLLSLDSHAISLDVRDAKGNSLMHWAVMHTASIPGLLPSAVHASGKYIGCQRCISMWCV